MRIKTLLSWARTSAGLPFTVNGVTSALTGYQIHPPGRVPLAQVPQVSPQRRAAWLRAGLPGGNPPAEDGR